MSNTMQLNSVSSIETKLNELNISFGHKLSNVSASDVSADQLAVCLDQMRAQLDDYKTLMAQISATADHTTKGQPSSPSETNTVADRPKKSYADVIHNRHKLLPQIWPQHVMSPPEQMSPHDVFQNQWSPQEVTHNQRLPQDMLHNRRSPQDLPHNQKFTQDMPQNQRSNARYDLKSDENEAPNGVKKCPNNGVNSDPKKRRRIPLVTTPRKIVSGHKSDQNDNIVSAKSDNNREKELRLEIERQFFGSHLPSLKETVDFVSDRITSKCIRRVRNEVYVKCKQSYNESIAITAADTTDHFNTSELDLDCITNAVQSECERFVREYCMSTDPQIHAILPLLVIEDIDDCVQNFAAKIASRLAIDKSIDWVRQTITQTLIEKDLKVQMKKKMLNKHKCPEPTVGQLMATVVDITPTFSAVRDLMADLYRDESLALEASAVVDMIDELSRLRRQTTVLPKRTLDFMDVNIVDFSMALIANKPDLIVETVIRRFVDYWLEFKVTVEKYICPRNLFILTERSKCALKSWNKYETMLLKMLSNGITNHKVIESDCLWTLKQEWSDSTLNRLASCLKSVSECQKPIGGQQPDDGELDERQTIDWLSWFCTQPEEPINL